MLQIIKRVTKNFFNPFGKLEWGDDFTYPEQLEVRCITKEVVFTQAEVQYLRKVLADTINRQEEIRGFYLEDAKYYKELNKLELSKKGFKNHRKIKAELKKLVKIQQKLKHSLITVG